MILTNAAFARDGRTVICNYGTIESLDGETAESAGQRAYIRWLEEGWEQGGYRPMTREEFETAHPEVRNGR